LRARWIADTTVQGPPDAQSITTSAIAAAGDAGDGFEEILRFDIDGVMRAEPFRQRQAPLIGRRPEPRHDDAAGAGLLGGDDAGEALLARPLDDDAFADADLALEVGPLDAVAERQRQRGEVRGEIIGNAMKDRVRVKILVLAVAAPQRRRLTDRGRSVAYGAGLVERVGLVAQAEVAAAAIVAMAAGQILLERDAVALLDAEALRRGAAELRHGPDGLVPEDERPLRLRILQVIRPIAAADAAQLDAQESAVGGNGRFIEFAHLGAPDISGDGGADRCHG
jgi:hypothetical protein